jgi:hypothetical protein
MPKHVSSQSCLTHLDSVLSITDGGVALGVEGVDGDLVLGNVVEAVLESPVREGVNL